MALCPAWLYAHSGMLLPIQDYPDNVMSFKPSTHDDLYQVSFDSLKIVRVQHVLYTVKCKFHNVKHAGTCIKIMS